MMLHTCRQGPQVFAMLVAMLTIFFICEQAVSSWARMVYVCTLCLWHKTLGMRTHGLYTTRSCLPDNSVACSAPFLKPPGIGCSPGTTWYLILSTSAARAELLLLSVSADNLMPADANAWFPARAGTATAGFSNYCMPIRLQIPTATASAVQRGREAPSYVPSLVGSCNRIMHW
jgi:hypothetical protein